MDSNCSANTTVDSGIDSQIQQFLEHYDYDVPNPEHEPLRFAHYVKCWKYYIMRKQNEQL
jgi:hypothetical protein